MNLPILTDTRDLPTPAPSEADIHNILTWLESAGGNTDTLTAALDGVIDDTGKLHRDTHCAHRHGPTTATTWEPATVDVKHLCPNCTGYNLTELPGHQKRSRRYQVDMTRRQAVVPLLAAAGQPLANLDIGRLGQCATSSVADIFPGIAAAAAAEFEQRLSAIAAHEVAAHWPIPNRYPNANWRVGELWELDTSDRIRLYEQEATVADHANAETILDAWDCYSTRVAAKWDLLNMMPTTHLTRPDDYLTLGHWVDAEAVAQLTAALTDDLTCWLAQIRDFIALYDTTWILLDSDGTQPIIWRAYTSTGAVAVNSIIERQGAGVVALPAVLAWPLVHRIYEHTAPAVGERYLHVVTEPSDIARVTISGLVADGAALADAYACVTALNI
jgi:hypothetical protein